MSPHKPWNVTVRPHPGSSAEEVAREPDWGSGHAHHIGVKDYSGRFPGFTARDEDYYQYVEEAKHDLEALRKQVSEGKLVNFRDLIEKQKDFHLRYPDNRSLGWRYVLDTTEDWVKNEEDWPATVKRREAEKAASAEKPDGDHKSPKEEHEVMPSSEPAKHHDAYTTNGVPGDERLQDKYTPQELALLRALEHEREHVQNLQENDGKRKSPQVHNRSELSIDERDQFTPDNWLPRASDLIRLTGKHPMNAEAPLSHLFDAGLITPNELHYIRSHGAVPRLLWEFHKLDIEYDGKVKTLSMDDLKKNYDTINIPVALACDGNRRKEFNLIKKSKGFSWGAGGVSCAYWKGPLLRDVLLSAGIPEDLPERGDFKKRYWVNFEGADEPSGGKYATCIPFQYAMDPQNDVILPYEMNDVPLHPDHGYPVRLIIPGYVGGRCVKWLRRIWISDKENDSYYHIWDNRVVPAFVTEKDGPFAETLFHHPSSACNEQNLNSVIVKPAHGEKIPVSEARKGRSYRIQGYAYDGGGHEVQRVEVSLDGGETWLYCIRKFPDYPIRHGNKFWAWIYWHVDVETSHLLRAQSITVRCFNVFKNTQPPKGNWNIMGMMNNGWYIVRPEIVDDGASNVPAILFRHPTEPIGDGGWMKPSVENQIAQEKLQAATPHKEFTREEIEKHDKKDDCWIVVDGKVYDATSVLDWHPGGAAAILGHAGKVHQQTSEEFASIHDDFAYQKLNECVLGVVTDKAAKFIKDNAEAAAKEAAGSRSAKAKVTLQRHRWVPVKIINRQQISNDTRTYTFQLPEGSKLLGLGTCQHIEIGFHLRDRMLIRRYTPTRPLLPPHAKGVVKRRETGSGRSLEDGDGTFDLTVKTYFPDESQPGGALSNILDCIPLGEEVEIKGPTGEIEYHGNGNFLIEGKNRHFKRVSMVVGGSGITPAYSLIARILLTESDKTKLRVVDANKTENDILLRDELNDFEKQSKGQLKITHVLSHPSDSWTGEKGFVTEAIMKQVLFAPDKDSVALLCGPPGLIQKVALPALTDWGYVEDDNLFGF